MHGRRRRAVTRRAEQCSRDKYARQTAHPGYPTIDISAATRISKVAAQLASAALDAIKVTNLKK